MATESPAGELGLAAPAFSLPQLTGEPIRLTTCAAREGARRDLHVQPLSVRAGCITADRARSARACGAGWHVCLGWYRLMIARQLTQTRTM
jgi:hypothetical protein